MHQYERILSDYQVLGLPQDEKWNRTQLQLGQPLSDNIAAILLAHSLSLPIPPPQAQNPSMTEIVTETNPTHSCSPTDQMHHKVLLSSTRAMPQLNPLPALNTRTSLTPESSGPNDRSPSTEFLSTVDQICIFDTQPSTHDGATLYVVETYFFSPNSNIPAMRSSNIPLIQRPPLTSASRVSMATPTTASTSEHENIARRPDLCVHRRFSDFVKLRREAIAASCINAHFLCHYCRQFQTYIRFHVAQPVWFVRIVTTRKQRKKLLARFLADIMGFAQSRVQHIRQCNLHQSLPKLIQEFLTD